DRFAQLFLYKRAATKPSDAIGTWRYNFDTITLEPVDGNYHGWSTSVVDGLEFLWVATATAHSLSNVDSDIDNWDVDKLTSNGVKTAVGYLYQVTASSVTSVALPTSTTSYSFTTGLVTGSLGSWKSVPPNSGKGTKLWRTFAPVTAEAFTVNEPIEANDWEVATVMAESGVDGSNGIDGKPGNHGAGSYVVTVANQASIPNDAGKDNHILQLSGRAAQSADILTYKDDAKTFSKSYLRGVSTWSEFQFVFDGSAIVNGTLAAEALKAETTITDKLYISSTKSRAEMTLSGAGDYRMWSGNTDPVLANFSIDRWGNLKANNAKLTNADVSGRVTASSGSFTGTVNATSGSFTGTVNANAGTMNNITIAENCNVLGTIYANRIVGDVAAIKSLYIPTPNVSIFYVDFIVLPAPIVRSIVISGVLITAKGAGETGENSSSAAFYLNGQLINSQSVSAIGRNSVNTSSVGSSSTLPANTRGEYRIRLVQYYGGVTDGVDLSAATAVVTKLSSGTFG
ncbi:MAG: hypothetical protein ACRC9H_01360, partial [Aeromonas veronii]